MTCEIPVIGDGGLVRNALEAFSPCKNKIQEHDEVP